MLLAFIIFFGVVSFAAGVAKYILRLKFHPAPDETGHDSGVGCYQTWAAHRACPHGLRY
jgi:hypothetical protein